MSTKSSSILLVLITIGIIAPDTNGSNILVYLPSPSRSHFKPFEPLFMALANRGHNVTVVSMFSPQVPPPSTYNHLKVGDHFRYPSTGFAYLREQNYFEHYVSIHEIIAGFCDALINDTFTKMLMESKSKFDLIFTEVYLLDPFLAFGGYFDAPIIGLSFQSLQPVYHWVTKNGLDYSYMPHLYLPFSDRMNFAERTINAVFGIFSLLYYNYVSLGVQQRHVDSLMKSYDVYDIPKIEHVVNNISLILVESHFSVGHVRPNVPNVVEVAGLHIPPSQKLPTDIEQFINASENGIIYVSLGTLVTPESMHELGVKLANIFRKFPRYGVIWKWNPKSLPKMDHVLVREWLPQTDILNHPKTKLFISHGGYHSIIEAVNGGVPLLCLPLFTDQHHNTAIVTRYEFGKQANPEADEQQLFNHVQELLANNKYAENAKFRSKLFKDRPMNPLDLAIYWTEYVIRHKGASHLKSAAIKLTWYQYLLLDVILFIVIGVIFTAYALKLFFHILYKSTSKFLTRDFRQKIKIS